MSEPTQHGLSWEGYAVICTAIGMAFEAMRRLWNASAYLQSIEMRGKSHAAEIAELKVELDEIKQLNQHRLEIDHSRDLERAVMHQKINALLRGTGTEFPEEGESE